MPVASRVPESAGRPIHAAAVAACALTRGYIGVNAATATGPEASYIWLWNGSKVTSSIAVPGAGVHSITCIPGSTSVLVTAGRALLELTATHRWRVIPQGVPLPGPPPPPGVSTQVLTDIVVASATDGTAVGYDTATAFGGDKALVYPTILHFNGRRLLPVSGIPGPQGLLAAVAFRPGTTTLYAVGNRRSATATHTLVEYAP